MARRRKPAQARPRPGRGKAAAEPLTALPGPPPASAVADSPAESRPAAAVPPSLVSNGRTTRKRRGRIGRFFVIAQAALLLGILVWLGWRPVVGWGRRLLARHAAAEVRTALQAGRLPQAMAALNNALRWNSDDAAVVEATVLCLQAQSSPHPALLLRQLRLLQDRQALTLEQLCLMGRTLVSLGQTLEAQQVLDRLPVPRSAAAAELEAAIRRAEGLAHEAALELDQAEDAGGPGTRLSQALDGLSSPFPELVKHSRDELWHLLELPGPTALQAAAALARDPTLTAAEAGRLLQAVQAHPQAGQRDRLGALSALMRTQPERRADILRQEAAAFEQGNAEGRLELMRWLAREREHDLLVRLLPAKLISQSADCYAAVAEALVNEARWQELDEMLHKTTPPVSRPLELLWQAEVCSHLHPDAQQEARHLLEASIEAAKAGQEVITLYKAAEFARKAGIADLAAAAYLAAAALSERQRVVFLQRACDMALQQKDTALLLDISSQLHRLRPENAVYASRSQYYSLLLGQDMEVTAAAIPQAASATTAAPRGLVPAALLHALAAFRLGSGTAEIRANLSPLADVAALPPGQRAVAAGLLAAGGKTAAAFQLAEKTHDRTLLREELALLRLAR